MSDTGGAWWRTAVLYQIYVRSFQDSDGDGLGDLPGIRSRLQYVRELGVDGIWLTPFYPTPDADHGYDVPEWSCSKGTVDALEARGLIRRAGEAPEAWQDDRVLVRQGPSENP